MALEFQNRYFDIYRDPEFRVVLRRDQLTRVGEAETDLFVYGYAEYWLDRPAQPGEFYTLQQGERVLQNDRVEQVDTWVEWEAGDQREELLNRIDLQVPNYSATDTLRDIGRENDVRRYASAASERATELQATDDADLGGFDPTINPTSPQDEDTIYSRLTSGIVYLVPWEGQPGNDIGFLVTLEVSTGDGSDGSEARLLVVEGNDAGAVLPFVQDVGDAKLWSVESRQGHKWSDPNQGTAIQLLWGAGSLPVSPVIRLEKLHDRKADWVRYGQSTLARGRRAKKARKPVSVSNRPAGL